MNECKATKSGSPSTSLLVQDFGVPGLRAGCIVCPGMVVPQAAQYIVTYYDTAPLIRVGVACGHGRLKRGWQL